MYIVYFNRLYKICQLFIIIGMKNKSVSEFSKKICIKVQLERQKRKLSQEQLAIIAGLNRNTIGKLERGEVSPSIDTLEKIAKVFSMSFNDLTDVSKVNI